MRVERRKKNMVVLDSSIGKVSRSKRMFVSREEVRRHQAGSVTVVLVCVIAAMCAVFGILKVLTDITRPEIKNELPGVSAEAANYDNTDAMTIAFVRLNDDEVPEKLMLARFEPSEERIYVSGVPLNVVTGEDALTLAQRYADGGAEKLAQALQELTECEKIYTLLFDYVDTRKLINYFDGVTLTLKYDIDYTSPNNDRNLNVVAGTRLYTGWEIARLLDYPGWQGGDTEQLYMYTYVLTEFFNQNFHGFTDKSLLKFFNHVCTYSENDISTNAFHKVSDGLMHISDINDGDACCTVELEWTPSGAGVVPTEKSAMLLHAAFGDRVTY